MSACLKCGFDPCAAVTSSWRFQLARSVRSGNDHVHNVGGSRWAYKAERQGWLSDMTGCRLIFHIPIATGLRRVTLTRLYGKGRRAYDVDNARTGLKPVVDAMVKAGMLIGDRPDQAEIHVAQERSPTGKDALVVLLEELTP